MSDGRSFIAGETFSFADVEGMTELAAEPFVTERFDQEWRKLLHMQGSSDNTAAKAQLLRCRIVVDAAFTKVPDAVAWRAHRALEHSVSFFETERFLHDRPPFFCNSKRQINRDCEPAGLFVERRARY